MRKTPNGYIDTFQLERIARRERARWIASFFERRKH